MSSLRRLIREITSLRFSAKVCGSVASIEGGTKRNLSGVRNRNFLVTALTARKKLKAQIESKRGAFLTVISQLVSWQGKMVP
jgi:hypothetical protein